MKLDTPLAKVRGLGPAKTGVHQWAAQRLTAIALIPLGLWFIYSLLRMPEMDHTVATNWILSPLVAVFLLLFIIALFYHMQLGLQIVLEDYIHCKTIKFISLIALKLASFFAGLAAVVAVMKIYLGA